MSVRPRILMLFLDGVGIGRKDPLHNPFLTADIPVFRTLMGGKLIFSHDARRPGRTSSVVPVNATLGVAGLPQSGTGQTALLTGINSSGLIDRHFGPYPPSALRPVLEKKNIFVTLKSMGRKCLYANAFPRQYFEFIRTHKARVPAIASAWQSTGSELNDSHALISGKGISADITNERWAHLGYSGIPVITPQDAGRRLVRLLRSHDFVLFEYYFTDKAGHHQSMDDARAILGRIDALMEGIFSEFDEKTMLFILTSDHGNMEDLSVRTHTRNPVPLVSHGLHHRSMMNARSLIDIAPLIANILE